MLILISWYKSQCHCTTEPNPRGTFLSASPCEAFQHQMQLNVFVIFSKIRSPRFTAQRANAFGYFTHVDDKCWQSSTVKSTTAGCRCMQLEACSYKHRAPHTHDCIWSPKVSTMWLLNLVSLHILQTDSWHQLLRWYWEQIALMLRQHGATSEFKQLSSITNTLSSTMHIGRVVKNRECLSGSLLHLSLSFDATNQANDRNVDNV